MQAPAAKSSAAGTDAQLALCACLLVSGQPGATEPTADAFEAEPEYRSDQVLQPALLSGPSWQIDPVVPMRGSLVSQIDVAQSSTWVGAPIHPLSFALALFLLALAVYEAVQRRRELR